MSFEDHVDKTILNIPNKKIQSANLQCAPGREFEAGSCISLVVLEDMAQAYNKVDVHKDKIKLSCNLSVMNPQKYKLYLIHELSKRLEDKCDTHKCWTEQDFVTNMKQGTRRELIKYTFRPNSPQGKFEWLSTFDINDTMHQYEIKYNDFKFFGAVPMDFADISSEINHANYDDLIKKGITKLGIIFNLDDSTQSGSHWVAMYTDLDKGHIFYFDSFAVKPEKRVRDLMRKQARFIIQHKKIELDHLSVKYNNVQHQHLNTECGVYSINFLVRMARGDNIDKVFNNPISDKEINKCRKVYFDRHKKNA